MEERRTNWKIPTKAELARNRRVEILLSERSNIQREMADVNLLSSRYDELCALLRENAAKLASA